MSEENVQSTEEQVEESHVEEPNVETQDTVDHAGDQVESTEGDEQPDPVKKRIGQIWARAKKAEGEVQRLREEKAALEAENRTRQELGATRTQYVEPTTKVLTWDDLKPMIAEGKTTLEDAIAYREKISKQEAAEAAARLVESRTQAASTIKTADQDLGRYTKVMPQLRDRNSTERQQVQAEYDWICTMDGEPKTPADKIKYELKACRQAFGNVDALEKKQQALEASRANRETHMETAGGNRPGSSGKPNLDAPPKGLSERQLDYYKNGIKKGQYKDWKEVHEELAWTPPKGRR